MVKITKKTFCLLICLSSAYSVALSPKRAPSRAEMQKIQSALQQLNKIIAQSKNLLTAFEGLLDKTSSILSQKIQKFDSQQAEMTTEILQHISQIRKSVYEGKTEIFDTLERSMNTGFSPEALGKFLRGLSSIMRLAAEFGSYLEKHITAKMRYEKSFNITRYMLTIGKANPRETLVNDIFSLESSIMIISNSLDHFDETAINKAALFIENNIISPFFKYNLDQILWYVGCWGGIGALLSWQFVGKYLAKHRYNYQRTTKNESNNFLIRKEQVISNHGHTNQSIDQSSFVAEEWSNEHSIFKKDNFEGKFGSYSRKNNNSLEFTDSFKQSLNKKQKFFYKIMDKIGYPSVFFDIPDDGSYIDPSKKAEYREILLELYGSQNNTTLSTLDHAATGLLSNHYPIVTFAATLLWPTFKESWDKSVWPSITGNIKAVWNKMLGGMYEKRAIEGDFLIFPDHTLEDIIGMEQEKEDLYALIEFLLNPISFAQQHGNKITKAFLFTGPTRTGKTHLYKAFVGSLQKRLRMLGRSVTSIRCLEFPVHIVKQYGISNLLKYIKQQAPAVAFIDEVDLIQLQRSTDAVILADFLTGLALLFDGDPGKPVLLFFATNKSQHLDDALKTKGRFGKEIAFDYPSVENRKKFLLKLFQTFNINASQFDIDAIVQQLHQQSYEMIEHLVHESMMRASIRGVPFNQEVLESAIDSEILKILSADRKDLTAREWEILAAHFAGQALLFLLIQMPEVLHKITISAVALASKEEHVVADVMQKDEEKQKKVIFGNTFTMTEGDTEKLATRELIVNQIKRLISGFVAEEILLGSCGATCHPDYKDEAYNKVISILLGGIKFDKLPDHQKTQISNKAFELLEEYIQELRELLMGHKDLLKLISDALLTQKTLTRAQLETIKDEFEKAKHAKQGVMQSTPAPEVAN